MTRTKKQSTEAAVREIRRKTRRKFAPEEKVRIVLEGLRGEQSISELCRREGIASNLYYRWSKDFLEAGKKQLAGDAVRGDRESAVGECARCAPKRDHLMKRLRRISRTAASVDCFFVRVITRLSPGPQAPQSVS